MQSEVRPLRELCSLIADCPHSTPVWTDSGYIVVRNQNIKNGRLDLSDASFTDAEHFAHRTRRAMPTAGDIIFTREAPMGEVCMIPAGLECCVGQRQVLLRPNPAVVDGRYLLYALQSPRVQHEIGWNEGTGSTVSNVRIPVLEALRIPTPALEDQRVVGGLLGVLDDRVDLLRQTNATLESIAQALFKSWFIDFDPVRAKAEGREPEGMDAATAALFPAEFEESELGLGLIPKGWRFGSVREVCSIFDSRRVPLSGRERSVRKGPYPYYGAAALMDYIDDYLFDGVYLLLGEDGSVTNPDGTPIVQYVWGRFWVNNHAHVLQGANGIGTEHLMLGLQGLDFSPYVTGAVQAKLNQANLFRIPFLIPSDAVSTAFAREVDLIYAKFRSNVAQLDTLAELRDTLLPRLISGKLRLPEAKVQAEEALA